MIGTTIIFFGIAFVVGIGAIVFSYLIGEKHNKTCVDSYQYGYFFGTVITFFIMVGLYSLDHYCSPQPIDVYRNKTELKITNIVENDKIIRSDSTVVFK